MGTTLAPPTTAVPDLVQQLRNSLGGISQERLARLLDVSLRTVARWQKLGSKPDAAALEQLQNLNDLVQQLSATLPPKDVLRWLSTPQNTEFVCTPVQLLTLSYGKEKLDDLVRKALRSLGQPQPAVAVHS